MNAFAYAQARLQSRHGARPGEDVWQQLHSLVELNGLLEQARATPLRRWLTSVTPDSPSHEIERLLRRRLRETIHEFAAWLPATWRPALIWTEVLVDLPALAWLLDGQPPLSWMSIEENLGSFAAVDPELRHGILAKGPLAALVRDQPSDRVSGAGLRRRWLAEWLRRLPRHEPLLRRMAREIETHVSRFDRNNDGGWPARRALEQRITFIFRQGLFTPAATFAFLLLQALELERLRAEIMSRALFSTVEA